MRWLAGLVCGSIVGLVGCTEEADLPGEDSEPTTSTTATQPVEPEPGDHDLTLPAADGQELRYRVHAPPSYDEGTRLPLVLAFPGSDDSPREMARYTGLDELADEHGFLVVYPDLFTEVEEVGLLLDELDVWSPDPSRIYATGFSMGGQMTYDLAAAIPGRFAALAPVSGILPAAFLDPPAGDPVPLLTVQGGSDHLVTPHAAESNRAWAEALRCGRPTVTQVRLPGTGPAERSVARCAEGVRHIVVTVPGLGHEWPAGASEEIWAFFESERRPG